MAKRPRKKINKSSRKPAPPQALTDQPPVSEPLDLPPARSAFAGWPMIIAWIAMMVFTFHACTHMVAAGDTWVAMACGRHFVNHGVDTVEPFSANSHHAGPTEQEIETWPRWAQWIADTVGIDTVKKWHPTGWVNQNWLTHVIFYSLVPKASYADGVSFPSEALVYWKVVIYIITVVCVFYAANVMGVNPALSAAFACFAMFIGRSFLDIRPAGFSNMLTAVFILILILTTYRNALFIWLIVPLTVFWCNVHGGYIYVFIVMAVFLALHIPAAIEKRNHLIIALAGYALFLILSAAVIRFSRVKIVLMVAAYIILAAFLNYGRKRLTSFNPRAICHILAATVAAFFASIIFNPFHLTNLTHTFVISISEHAKRWRDIHEWHPAFEWSNPVGTAVPFAVMYGIAWALIVIWAVTMIITAKSVGNMAKRKAEDEGGYTWPKIDLAMMAVAAMTIYMAIRSRRFIPIAAYAACPVIALLIDQVVRAITAADNFHKRKRLVVPPMPATVQQFFVVVAGLTVALVLFGPARIGNRFLGFGWAPKFKNVYLDPWPNDPNLTSIFMRMTASDAKPFYATKFMKMNRLEGKMFNYWTEGGAIAFGQQPDPNTGKTPLQLFMDGRAQAAYDRKTFDIWTGITSGGPTVHAAAREARALGKDLEQVLTAPDYRNIGKWVSDRLKQYGVWTALMPAGQFTKPFTRGLEYSEDWAIVFLNNKQKLFVDITTPKGMALMQGIVTGTTRYPDDFHKSLALGRYLLMQRDAESRQRGFDLVKKAFYLNPSPAPILEIILLASRDAALAEQIKQFCSAWVSQFEKNRSDLRKKDGYRLRLEAARLAYVHLERTARVEKDNKLAETYIRTMTEYAIERNELSRTKRW
ncbi:MAG: hypothetical protein JW720_14770 [Sedimentisphaerales bacterium]|nr:hypothetical protein [Sedimentisphaerales bacterium]